MMRLRLVLTVVGALLLMAPTAWAVDTIPPSTPTNLRETGTFGGRPVLGWDASADNAGNISYYRVLVNGSQAYRPRANSVKIYDLARFCHVFPGYTYTFTIQAVDTSGNRSAVSNQLRVTVR